MEFTDTVVIVTGAGSGIGATTARMFGERGATVVAVDRDEGAAEATAGLITRQGGTATALRADLTREGDVREVVSSTLSRHGRVDVLHNNAGVFPAAEGRLHEVDARSWDLTLRVNLQASVLMSQAVLPSMIATGGGSIVNTSSAQARVGDVAWTSYGVAKAALESLTRYTAAQYGRDGIRCNCIAPGLVATPGALARLPAAQQTTYEAATLLGRLGRPEEIAEVVLFLASGRSSFLTGQVLCVDGGLLSHMPVV